MSMRAPRLHLASGFSLSCIVPVLNEAAGIASFLRRLHRVMIGITPRVEIVVVNDGSTDGSAAEILRCADACRIHYIELSRNFGKEFALQAGLDAAAGDCVCLIDGDDQHPMELIPEMVQRWRAGIDMVYALRRFGQSESWPKSMARSFVHRLLTSRSGLEIPVGAGDFRVLDRKIVQLLRTMPERTRFMKGLYAWGGFSSEAIPYEQQPRTTGTSKYTFHTLSDLAACGITAFSTTPLRLVSLLGLLTALAAVVLGLWIVFEKIFLGQPIPGFATLAASILLLSGIQLLGLGIVGEYVGRIFDEVKQRPLYVVARELNRGALLESVQEGTRA
ncbi:glycosyltransferase family 2 protein [Steroidobacter cummioxidans]|uniref:glycosyltransferase family 2 protein n=1 Tax=Steroidobacter cummioxidans TaxID=1803913 RepID=UPI000E310D3B|nr:glycosyltransferase family 2 protein [Steroidobacter cummioxidans]